MVEDTYINVDASFPLELKSFYHVNDCWDWVSSQALTIWESSPEYVANNLDEESTIKNILTDSRWFGPQDDLRIKKYNQRLYSIYLMNRKKYISELIYILILNDECHLCIINYLLNKN